MQLERGREDCEGHTGGGRAQRQRTPLPPTLHHAPCPSWWLHSPRAPPLQGCYPGMKPAFSGEGKEAEPEGAVTLQFQAEILSLWSCEGSHSSRQRGVQNDGAPLSVGKGWFSIRRIKSDSNNLSYFLPVCCSSSISFQCLLHESNYACSHNRIRLFG